MVPTDVLLQASPTEYVAYQHDNSMLDRYSGPLAQSILLPTHLLLLNHSENAMDLEFELEVEVGSHSTRVAVAVAVAVAVGTVEVVPAYHSDTPPTVADCTEDSHSHVRQT